MTLVMMQTTTFSAAIRISLASICICAAPVARAQAPLDILIWGGTLIDGTGSSGRRADVGIRGDRIVFVGMAGADATAARTIDATGLIVSPGFIDPHSHTDTDLASADPMRRANLPYLMQGVTTVVTNNDGRSPADLAVQFKRWTDLGIGTNVAAYYGEGTLRGRVVGNLDVKATPAQMEEMKRLVAKAMDDGALGMSTGLFYTPGNFAPTEEIIELSKVVAAKGGIYDTHMRDESSYSIGLIGSINETIRIGREARLPVHISHIKALGVDVWGQSDSVIKIIEKARREGIDVTANQYPYTASGTGLGALLPRWAESGGNDSLRAVANDPARRQKLLTEMTDNLRRRGGANTLLLTSGDSTVRGKTLEQIAREMNQSAVLAGLNLILSGKGGSVASFNMQESDIEKFMVQPWVSTGSDGSGGHPRKYGTFTRKIHEYGYMRGIMTLPQIIESSSSRTARQMHLADRGEVAVGKFADVIVFDEKTISDHATYVNPQELSTGMAYVMVNGKVVVDQAKYATGMFPGRVLRPR
jgi:N-acyl-D-aspartate/D-glutamate deacylase